MEGRVHGDDAGLAEQPPSSCSLNQPAGLTYHARGPPPSASTSLDKEDGQRECLVRGLIRTTRPPKPSSRGSRRRSPARPAPTITIG